MKYLHLKEFVSFVIVETVAFAAFFAVLSMELRGALFGFVFGLIAAIVLYLRSVRLERRRQRDQTKIDTSVPGFEAVERRYAIRTVILLPVSVLVGFIISLATIGDGRPGIGVGSLVGVAVSVAHWRFGGPGNPRWRQQ